MTSNRTIVSGVLAAALSGSPVFAQANSASVNVICGGFTGDLQRAIDNVPGGSTIVVNGACTNGPYYIRKDLHIVGTGAATLSGSGDRVIDITGANVRIENLTVDAAHNAYGILVEEGSSGIFDHITVSNAEGGGVQVMLASYAGITDSTLTNNVYGVFVAGSSSVWMDADILEGNTYASVASLMNSSAFVYNSQVHNGHIGVLVERMSDADLAGNTIENNTGPGLLISSRISSGGLGGNTIQQNAPDVKCEARGVLTINATQASTTKSTVLDPGCTIDGGPIF